MAPQAFDSKQIALGITGGIAAYKACDVIRELYRQGAHQVIPMLSPSAKAFITPLTLESLSRHRVIESDLETTDDGTPTHIALAQQCDGLLILPATANTLAKLAHGLADNIITTTALTFTDKPVVVAPAMNTRMWFNPATQRNLSLLASYGHIDVIPPDAGLLACGETGPGKLASLDLILLYLYRALHPQRGLLQGQRVVITAGGTEEAIDPIRVITNRGSGQMGVALADECFALGAEVVLLHSRPGALDRPYTIIPCPTVGAMLEATTHHFSRANGLIMTAAISDYTVPNPANNKLKKQSALTLALEQAPDILKACTQHKRPDQWVVGFAAETHEVLSYAQAKLAAKGCDVMVANDVGRQDIGLGSPDNEVILLTAAHAPVILSKADKTTIAQGIMAFVHQHVLSQRVLSPVS